MDFKINEIEFTELVQNVLNHEYILGLQPGKPVVVGKHKYSYDLVDIKNGTFVEIKLEFSSIKRPEYVLQIKDLVNFLLKKNNIGKYKVLLVFGNRISNNDRTYFLNELKSNSRTDYTILDLENVLTLATKHDIKYSDVFLKVLGDFPIEKHNTENENNLRYEDYVLQPFEKQIEIVKSVFKNFKGKFWLINLPKELVLSNEIEQGNNFLISKRNLSSTRHSNIGKLLIGDFVTSISEENKIEAFFQVVSPESDGSVSLRLIYRFPRINNLDELSEISAFVYSKSNNSNFLNTLYDIGLEVTIQILIYGETNPFGLESKINVVDDGIDPPNEPPNGVLGENNDDNDPKNYKDKIKFHIDKVETTDRLGRDPVAKVLANLINNDVFSNEEMDHAFMIHLQGSWGAGKSTFLNLVKKHLDIPDSRKWLVVDYNAWENQHIDPPWWSFTNQIYKQSKRKMPWWKRPFFCVAEQYRRFYFYTGIRKTTTLLFAAVLAFIVLFWSNSILNIISEFGGQPNDKNELGLKLKLFIEFLASLGSLVLLIYSLSKFITSPLFLKNSMDAKSFVEKSTDPMERVRKHHQSLLKTISIFGYQSAVFIDDLDRCDKQNVVRLLEGIQTLFKNSKVLYIVAADRKWITTCFEKHYVDFDKTVHNNSQKLGDLFLEKAFQLSVRLPKVSTRIKEKYWDYILDINDDVQNHLTNENRQLLIEQIKNAENDQIRDPEFLNNLRNEFKVSDDNVTDIVLEVLNENNNDVEHLLRRHHDIIDPNPRTIIRIGNEYAVYRNTLIAERKEFSPDILFRWIILNNRYSSVVQELLENLEILSNREKLNELFQKYKERKVIFELVLNPLNTKGGELTKEIIETIIGEN